MFDSDGGVIALSGKLGMLGRQTRKQLFKNSLYDPRPQHKINNKPIEVVHVDYADYPVVKRELDMGHKYRGKHKFLSVANAVSNLADKSIEKEDRKADRPTFSP